jgi:HlyD family secretion protein
MNQRIADTSSQDTVLEPAGRTRLWLQLGVGTVVVVAVLIAGIPMLLRWLSSEDSVSRDRLRIAEVTRGDFVRDISVQGRIVASVSPILYSPNEGVITFAVNPGDQVEVGVVIAEVDSPELTNQLQQAEALQAKLQVAVARNGIESRQQVLANQKTVDLANLALTAAARELRRAELAFKGGALKEVDYEKAQDDVEAAQFAHKHALADTELDKEKLAFESRTRQLELDQQNLQVQKLQREVDELKIISPVTGIVGDLIVKQKSQVAANMPVVSVVDLTQFEVEADVPQNYANDMGIGMTAEVQSGSEVYPVTVVSISPEIVDDQVTTRLRFAADPPANLRQNQRLTTRILLEQKKDVLMVQRGQFLQSGSGRFVYRVDDDVAYKQPVVLGARSLNTVEVLSGLKAGDRIIISSTELFEDADTILITN